MLKIIEMLKTMMNEKGVIFDILGTGDIYDGLLVKSISMKVVKNKTPIEV
jgi:hypothetical protein